MASELYVETLKGLTSGANANKVIIPSGQTLDITDWSPPAGTVLQVVNVTDNNAAGYSNGVNTGTWQSLLSASITPSSTSSKILLTTSIACGSVEWGVCFRILENGSTVTDHLGDTGDFRIPITFGTTTWGQNDDEISTASYSGLFSPASTASVTYTIQGGHRTGTNGWSYNRAWDSPSTNSSRGLAVSSIVLMEIAG